MNQLECHLNTNGIILTRTSDADKQNRKEKYGSLFDWDETVEYWWQHNSRGDI